MALEYEIIKSQLTVFVQDSSIDTFDASLAYPVALAQSYTLDETGDTQEVQDLCDAAAEWASPEVNRKSWTLSTDTLLLRNVGANNGTITLGVKKDAYQLSLGDIVWCVVGDAVDCSEPSGTEIAYKYGKAVITALSQAGSVGEFQTLSVTFTGKGELLRSA